MSFIEGVSLLLLLFVAMPFKYILGNPLLVKVIGMAHGILFIALVIWIILMAKKDNWSAKLVILSLISSSVPFGMYFFEKQVKAFYHEHE
jgi:integral membrane protein